jgi:hypothetical protein
MDKNDRRTAIYCRAASDHSDDRDSIIEQERQLLDYASEHGYAKATVYRDSGVSGLTLDRPAMNELTADIKAGEIRTVIAADTARIARKYPLFMKWREMLNGCGVGLILVKDGVHTGIDSRLRYAQAGDYLLPLLALSDPPNATPLRRYGKMRRAYLKEWRPILYSRLLLQEKLFPHLREIDEAAQTRLDTIADREQAHEIILAELVYS